MPDDLPPLDELYNESLILEDGSIADVSYESDGAPPERDRPRQEPEKRPDA